MHPNLKELEAELAKLHPSALDEAFLARLEASAEATLDQLTPAELSWEASLRAIAPAPLPDALLAECESVVAGLPFPADEKILLFPKASSAPRSHGRTKTSRMWAAAAAIALCGASAAVYFTPPTPSPPLVSSTANPPAVADPVSPSPALPTAPATNIAPANYTPTGYNRGFAEATDEGVIWKNPMQPHRVIRVLYKDKVTLKDPSGNTVDVEKPRIEYLLVPEKID